MKPLLLNALLLMLFFVPHIYAQSLPAATGQDSTKKFIDFRRTDPTNFPHDSLYKKPKEEVFPLSYFRSTGVWTELNPKVPRVNYFGINFVNKDTGWACGGSGAIIKTTNGGEDWLIAETPVTNLLLKIHSYNGQTVIATGYDGLILRSTDGGKNFVQVTSGVASGVTGDLWGLQMLNDTLGWACGNRNSLIKTTDNGLTWQILLTPGYTSDYWCIDFLNESYGFIAANGKVLKTTDGGNNWEIIQAGDTRSLYTIDAIDSLHIAAAGGPFGKNVYSSDGGFTWIQNANLIYENGVNSISFINADTGYAVGENWAIRKTENRGVTWWASAPVYSDWGLNLLEGGVGFASGGALRVYKTSNGYDNWKKLFIADNFSDVFFVNEQKGFAISPTYEDGKLYSTSNSGISWEVVSSAPGGNDILFIDNQTGFIGGSNLFKTTDGGESWYQVNGVLGGVGKIFFINQSIGWATSGGRILKTTDSGENWVVQITLPSDSYTSIFFVDSLNGWATSRYIWQTTDGGMSWIQRSDIASFMSSDVYFINEKGYIISNFDQKLYKSTNNGINWDVQLSSPYFIKNFGWLSDKHGLIMGGSIVYETNDSGGTWSLVSELSNIGLQKFHAPYNYLGYSTGNLGLIYKYIDTSIVPVELISFQGMV
ncbi:MAG: YCF48-related protein, partial [Ignavibacteriaceae bacterium]|nr:YCF48-related protein [Ignavibacteriaceae bacterium]